MDQNEYLSMRAVNSHALIEMMRSPLHCWARYFDPERKKDEPTAAMRFGSLVHTMILEPERFDSRYVVADINRRTNQGKAEFERILSLGMAPVSADEMVVAVSIKNSVMNHHLARELLTDGEPEKTIIFGRGRGLLPLKGRLDYLHPQHGIIELKTAVDASKRAFVSAVYRYGYHISAAFYRSLVRYALLAECQHTFVVVEPKPPYAVAVYSTPDSMLDEGRRIFAEQLDRLDECVASEIWPGYKTDTLDACLSIRDEIEVGEIEL